MNANQTGKTPNHPLVLSIFLTIGLAAPTLAQTSGTWAKTGSMNCSRQYHTLTLLPSGEVLAAGGGSISAELYNPAAGTWTVTGSMKTDRQEHTASLLGDGKVLIAGGLDNVAFLPAPSFMTPQRENGLSPEV
jgi:hypothetical protein